MIVIQFSNITTATVTTPIQARSGFGCFVCCWVMANAPTTSWVVCVCMFSGSMGRQIGSWEDTELIKSVWNILTSNMWIWKRRPKKPFQATRRQFKRLMNRIDWWWWWWWWQELLYCLAFLSKMPRLPLQGGSCYTDSEPSQVIMPPIKGANCSNLTRPGRQKVAEEGKVLYFQGDLGRWTYVVPDFLYTTPLEVARMPEPWLSCSKNTPRQQNQQTSLVCKLMDLYRKTGSV